MTILSPNYSWQLILFYFFAGFLFWGIFTRKTSSALLGLALSLSIVLIGSEYYEVPIFICSYLGLFGYIFPTALSIINHVLVVIIFFIFISISKLKLTKGNVALLGSGPLLTTPFLIWLPLLYAARTIGLIVLFVLTLRGTKL